MDLEGKWKAILIGGLITGLGPFVPFVNLACCLIPILGGVVAVAVHRNGRPLLLTNTDGIVLGAMSGAVGTAIYALLLAPVTLFLGGTIGAFLSRFTPTLSDVPVEVRPFLEFIFTHLGTMVGVAVFFRIVSQLALSLVFGIVGGVLGVAILKPRQSPI